MQKRKAVEPMPEDWERLYVLAETPQRQPGRELTLEELRQRVAESKGTEAEFFVQLLAIKEGKAKVWQPSTARLPRWTMQGDGLGSSRLQSCGYTCDDPAEQAFALAVMMMTGFSIPDFDMWLDSIDPCGARTELIVRREWVREALHANKEDAVRRHLEWLYLRRMMIDNGIALTELAGIGEGIKQGRSKGGKKAAEARQAGTNAAHGQWVAAAKDLLDQGKSSRNLASILATRYAVTAKTIRNALKKAGVK